MIDSYELEQFLVTMCDLEEDVAAHVVQEVVNNQYIFAKALQPAVLVFTDEDDKEIVRYGLPAGSTFTVRGVDRESFSDKIL